MFKKTVAILLALCMVFCASGCKTGNASSEQPSSSSQPSSSADTASDDTGSENTESSSDSSIVTQSYTDLGGVKGDGQSSAEKGQLWTDPSSYTIVIPNGDSGLKKYAAKIQRYFSDNYRVTLPIVTDAVQRNANEILVGKTNRPESNSSIATGSYQVSVKDSKLVFDGGHAAMIDAAVQRFLTLAPKDNKTASFSGSTDFKATALSGYDYVWGDEFEGEEIDFTKWTFIAKMSGTDTGMISSDRDVIDIGDGKLKLRAIKYTSKAYPKVKYKMPISVVTQMNMMFTYGYCEIKAKMPFFEGAWPSFWTQSNTGIGERKCFDYFVEVDIFEVFGSPEGRVVSNIHKWYTDKSHTQWGYGGQEKTTWTATNPKTINNEYHVYGWQWTPKEMVIYVDGKKIMTYDITTTYDNVDDMSGFHDPQFIIFNNHLFLEDSSWRPNTIIGNEGLLPSEYFIEYFRLYQKKGEGKLWTDETVYKTFNGR